MPNLEKKIAELEKEVTFYKDIISKIEKEKLQEILHELKTSNNTTDKKKDFNSSNITEMLKRLQGVIPICSYCKKIRDENELWEEIEEYITKHSEVDFSHSLCPECAENFFPNFINN